MALVGIVLVSHSEKMASGLRDLLRQVATEQVRVEPAGGTAEGGLGTSAERIEAHVLEEVRPGSIVVLHVMYPSRRESLRAVEGIVRGVGRVSKACWACGSSA